MTRKVKAIWIIDEKKMFDMFPQHEKHWEYSGGIWIVLDEAEVKWDACLASVERVPHIGKELTGWASLSAQTLPHWEAVKGALINRRLGDPNLGSSVKYGNMSLNVDGICICDTKELVVYGCPSAKGRRCRSL